jgi:hypothetical protein
MKIITGNRGSGRTTELIKISHEKQIPIVCSTNLSAKYILDMAKEMKLEIPTPLSISSFETAFRGRKIEGILIDNVEFVLSHIFNTRVDTISVETDGMIFLNNDAK